ncbi:MAG: putative porin [Steroidobacteraceae bacterium]
MFKQAAAAVVGSVFLLNVATAASTDGADEIAQLKAMLASMQTRIEQLEAQQQQQAQQVTEQQEAIDSATDALAQTKTGIGDWVSRFQWKGDLRYRNESFDVQYNSSNRVRDRIRARAGFVAKVNDTLSAELRLASGGDDPRSSNQTLTDTNSRKAFGLDLAYLRWQPRPDTSLSLGKIKQPWSTPSQSMFFDGDVNPEGIGLAWASKTSGVFANAFYLDLAERSSRADSNLIGGQLGWTGSVGDGSKLTLVAGYFDHGAVEGYNALFGGGANGNTTVTNSPICRAGIATCVANDFNIVDVSAEWSTSLSGRPFSLYADLAQNTAADDLNNAYGLGFSYGRAKDPGTWEIGYLYQQVEKDALYGQWVDSDFADGNTDGRGSVLKFAYAFAKNFKFNATLFLNETNVDVPTSVSGVGPVTGRDYKRLQLDLVTSF